jgi:N-acetylglutamate synthase-like GNAT family acetyltransferase/2-polyprenyl-3-methyl-5-hydroxy-6-metoxy-1,4-benzoquinol methylase
MSTIDIKEAVREKYGRAAEQAKSGRSSCCGAGVEPQSCCSPITSNLYNGEERGEVPEQALRASLGCGNPTALAQLNLGEIVLDLGSGGGIDVLLSARRVGPTGKAYGLDMTDEMLSLARENQKTAGVDNVEFLKGEIENIPLPDNSVDVIISNCVINLSADKDRVLREAFRVLKAGGRFAVSDVVVRGEVPSAIRKNVELWIGCMAGALQDTEYVSKLAAAGFEKIEIEPTRVYGIDDARQVLTAQGIDVDAVAPQVTGSFMSAFVRAYKPLLAVPPSSSCCAKPVEPARATGCCEPKPSTVSIQSCCSPALPRAATACKSPETVATVTRAAAEDLEKVLHLLESVQLPTAGVAEHFGNFFIAKDAEGRLAGAIGLERYGTVGILRSAVVAPRRQGSGIGSKLAKILVDFARAEGLKELVLFTHSAQGFLARFGFVPANREDYEKRLGDTTQWVCCASAEFMCLKLS